MRPSFRSILSVGAGDGLSPNLRRTPDHPPYSEMVNVALRSLAEENGSTESSISACIRSIFHDLPWGHDRLLPYYLRKLVVDGELTSPSPDRYQLALHLPPITSPVSLPMSRRGRPFQTPKPKFGFRSLSSAPPLRQGRARPYRRRGRPPKILSEGRSSLDPGKAATPLDLVHATPPLRRPRGRPRIRPVEAIGHCQTTTRKLASCFRKSRGIKRKYDGIQARITGEPNNLSGILAFCDNIKNAGSECGILENSEHIDRGHTQLGDGHPFVDLGQSVDDKVQILPEEPPVLIPEQEKMPPFVALEHHLQEVDTPFVALEKTVLSQVQSSPKEILPLLTPELANVLPLIAPELAEHEETHPIVTPEQVELNQKSPPKEIPSSLIPEPGILLPFLTHEVFEYDHEVSLGTPLEAPLTRDAMPFLPLEQAELGQKQSNEEPPLLSPIEVGKNVAVSSRKKKSRKGSRLRLWFEA